MSDRTRAGAGRYLCRHGLTLGLFLLGACGAFENPPTSTSTAERPSFSKVRGVRDTFPSTFVSVFLRYSVREGTSPNQYRLEVEQLQPTKVYGGVTIDKGNRVLAFDADPSLLEQLKALPWVEGIEIDSARVTLASDQIPWGVAEVQAPSVHALGNIGAFVIVAVIDGGVNCNHPDLAGRVIGGWDFLTATPTYCFTQNTRGVNHGTASASVVAASADGSGILGIAPGASIYAYRVCDDNGTCSPSAIYSALLDARITSSVTTASVANCGAQVSTSIKNAIQQLWQNGILTFWGAGNGAIQPCPPGFSVSGYAAAPYSVAVAAHLPNGSFATGFASGPAVDLNAPTNVTADSALVPLIRDNFGGTSAAAPHAAGIAALLVSAGFQVYGAQELFDRLTKSAIDGGATGFDNFFGYGKPNAFRAVHWLTSVAIDGPSFPSPGPNTWNSTYRGGVAPVSFQWERRNFCDTIWYPVAASSSYVQDVAAGEHFYLRVTISSASFGNSGTSTKLIGGLASC